MTKIRNLDLYDSSTEHSLSHRENVEPGWDYCAECEETHFQNSFCEECESCLYENSRQIPDERFPLFKCTVCEKVNFWD